MRFLAIIFSAVLQLCFLTSPVLAQENKEKLAQIQEFKNDLESCEKRMWDTLRQKYDGLSQDNTPDRQIVINKITCYEAVGNKVIDTFYSHTNEEMKKNFGTYIKAAAVFYGNLNNHNIACYNPDPNPSKKRFCGTIALDFAVSDQEEIVEKAIMDMLNYTESFYK